MTQTPGSSQLTVEDLAEMLAMADIYGWKCTKQHEKFMSYAWQHGERMQTLWTWEDCQAAYELINESTTGRSRFDLREAWKKGKLTEAHLKLIGETDA